MYYIYPLYTLLSKYQCYNAQQFAYHFHQSIAVLRHIRSNKLALSGTVISNISLGSSNYEWESDCGEAARQVKCGLDTRPSIV